MNHAFQTAAGETVCLILGFWLFFALMKKFAWGPILDLLDARREEVRAGFDEIKKLQSQAADAQKGYEDRLKAIEAEAREKIQEAVREGERVAAEISDKARAEAADIVESARKRVDLEMATLRKQLREETIALTLAVAEKLISTKLDAAKDRELVGSFISELEKRPL